MTAILETKMIEQALVQAKTHLKTQFANEVFFNEFVLPLTLVGVQDNLLVLEAKNLFAQQILINDYTAAITTAINTILKSNFQVKFIVKGEVIKQTASGIVHTETITQVPTVQVRGVNSNYV
ncbi:MAG: hypothetical protein LBV37_02340, partial [Mycoplasmataceae bacterium]|nr:hypothetical protein [Mycoplasmataceae bacterium]